MEEIIIQSAPDAAQMAPVRSSTNTKLAEERLNRKNVEQNGKSEEKPKKEELTTEAVKSAVIEMNNLVEKFSTRIGFSVDAESKQMTIIVTDKETGKVIRQIPAEDIMDLNQKMEEITGIIFDERG